MSHRCNACVSGAIGHKIGAGLSTSCCIDPASISEAARVGSKHGQLVGNFTFYTGSWRKLCIPCPKCLCRCTVGLQVIQDCVMCLGSGICAQRSKGKDGKRFFENTKPHAPWHN